MDLLSMIQREQNEMDLTIVQEIQQQQQRPTYSFGTVHLGVMTGNNNNSINEAPLAEQWRQPPQPLLRNRSGHQMDDNNNNNTDDDDEDDELAGLLLIEDMSHHNIDSFRNDASDLEALVGQCREHEEGRAVARKRQFVVNVVGALVIAVLVVLVLLLTNKDSGVVEPHDDTNGSPSDYPLRGIHAAVGDDDDSEDNPFFG